MNSLGIDLTGKDVVVAAEYLTKLPPDGPVDERVFHVDGGFGAVPHTSGNAVFGHWVSDGARDRVEGFMVERLATDEERGTARVRRIQSEKDRGTLSVL